MTAFADRDALATAIIGWAHHTFVLSENLTFIEMATERLGRSLRVPANEGQIEISPVGSLYPLPADFREARVVSIADQGTDRILQPLSIQQLSRWQNTGSDAYGYFIRSKLETSPAQTIDLEMVVKPYTGEDVSLVYWQTPEALAAGGDTNPVLTQYPELYLHACLIEFHTWKQDFEARDQMLALFTAELQAANKAAQEARYGPGLNTSGARSRGASSRPVRVM